MSEPTFSSARPRKRASRLTREEWLDQALYLLQERGPAAMTLDSLTRHLGVTTGSFYHHFKNHGSFLEELTDRYIERYTLVVSDRLSDLDLPPRELLMEAMRMIVEANLGGMDIPFRGLSLSYPQIAEKIRAMDELRSGVISGLYQAMGYSGEELRMRTHAFVVINSLEHGVATGLAPGERLKLLDERIKLLID